MALVGMWAAKKVVLMGAANSYGWHLIYRRMAEQSRYFIADPSYVNSRVKDAIRAPSQAYDVMTDAEVAKLMVAIMEAGAQTTDAAARKGLPSFMYNLIASAVETFGRVGETAADTPASTRSESVGGFPSDWPPALEQQRRRKTLSEVELADQKSTILVEKRGRIAIWTMNQPRKLNPLNVASLSRMSEVFAQAAADREVEAVVLTGAGRYFSAGADFTDVGVQPSFNLSAVHAQVASLNTGIFHPFIHFEKPLFVAANGPAVGGGTTLQLLCDAVLSTPRATFHTPFKQLGITAEGCSTFTFERKMGKEGARRMLTHGEKIDALTALELGFVDVLVEDAGEGDSHQILLDEACRFAEAWVSKGRGRTTKGLVDQLDRVNVAEGKQLADAIFTSNFWSATLGKALNWKQ